MSYCCSAWTGCWPSAASHRSSATANPEEEGVTDPPLPTVRTALAARCRVAALCLDCDRARDLDLKALAKHHADTPLIRLPLRCRCGSRRYRIIVSGREPG
jgi:hypothetical protein